MIRVLPDQSSTDASFVEVVDSFTNIAPVMDAALTEIDGHVGTTIQMDGA